MGLSFGQYDQYDLLKRSLTQRSCNSSHCLSENCSCLATVNPMPLHLCTRIARVQVRAFIQMFWTFWEDKNTLEAIFVHYTQTLVICIPITFNKICKHILQEASGSNKMQFQRKGDKDKHKNIKRSSMLKKKPRTDTWMIMNTIWAEKKNNFLTFSNMERRFSTNAYLFSPTPICPHHFEHCIPWIEGGVWWCGRAGGVGFLLVVGRKLEEIRFVHFACC